MAGSGDAWTGPDVERLTRVFRNGGGDAARAAFPERSVAAVRAALRRYVQHAPSTFAPRPIDVADVRARLSAMPLDVFTDRLPELLARNASYQGAL